MSLRLSPRDLSTWDDAAHRWRPVAGRFVVSCGPSSRELPLSDTLDVGVGGEAAVEAA